MLVEDIQELSTRAKNSLIRNGYTTLEDIDKANFYDIFALPCFKKTVKNMKIVLKVMHDHGYPYWGGEARELKVMHENGHPYWGLTPRK